MALRISSTKVKSRMVEAGINSTHLAQKSSLSPSTIDRILNNRASNYSEYTVQRIANVLGCSVYDLYTDDAIATGIADSAANAVANVVVEAVADAISVVADDVAPEATPEEIAEAMPKINVTQPPAFDISAYFTYMQDTHKAEIEMLEKVHAAENAERDKHLEDVRRDKNVWRCVALILGAVICFWLLWDLSHSGTGMLQYAKGMGLFGWIG